MEKHEEPQPFDTMKWNEKGYWEDSQNVQEKSE
jgi:hypothetical protein